MPHYRGDIIEVFFSELPYQPNDLKTHPAIIISNDDVYQQDGIYICVMMTHSAQTDKFTFEITNDLLVKPGDGSFSQARCHIVSYFTDENIIANKNRNSMKSKAVDRLVSRIHDNSLMEEQ